VPIGGTQMLTVKGRKKPADGKAEPTEGDKPS